MPTAVDLRRYAGQWIAQDKRGVVIAAAHSLTALERKLIQEFGYKENDLPAIMRVPEDGTATLLL
jgi:hypothetical protein